MMAPSHHAAHIKPNPRHNAINFLRSDHALISLLFSQYAEAKSMTKKKTLIAQICSALLIHTQLEEEIIYPAIAAKHPSSAFIQKITVKHISLRKLLQKIEGSNATREYYDEIVNTLSRHIDHHFKEIRNELLGAMKHDHLGLLTMGNQLAQRKDALHTEQEMALWR